MCGTCPEAMTAMQVSMHVHAHVHAHVQKHVYPQVYAQVYTHVYAHVCPHVYGHAYTHMPAISEGTGSKESICLEDAGTCQMDVHRAIGLCC